MSLVAKSRSKTMSCCWASGGKQCLLHTWYIRWLTRYLIVYLLHHMLVIWATIYNDIWDCAVKPGPPMTWSIIKLIFHFISPVFSLQIHHLLNKTLNLLIFQNIFKKKKKKKKKPKWERDSHKNKIKGKEEHAIWMGVIL